MVRGFVDDNVVHVAGKINPVEDVKTINLELVFADSRVASSDLRLFARGQGRKGKEAAAKSQHIKRQWRSLRMKNSSQGEWSEMNLFRFVKRTSSTQTHDICCECG